MVFINGMATGGGLIVAIGAQNAFVLSQGIRKHYVWVVALICAVCDAILIFCGAAGVGKLIADNPQVKLVTAIGGAIFLFYYGLRSLRSAMAGGALDPQQRGDNSLPLQKVVAATLGVTLLNPHVYLDTLLLVGSISGQFGENGRYVFAAGASTASLIWFFSLGVGGIMLAPLFQSKKAWRVLDSCVCLVMWFIGLQLVLMVL